MYVCMYIVGNICYLFVLLLFSLLFSLTLTINFCVWLKIMAFNHWYILSVHA